MQKKNTLHDFNLSIPSVYSENFQMQLWLSLTIVKSIQIILQPKPRLTYK